MISGSGGGTLTSGYSQFGHTNPGGTVAAFFNANTGKVRQGVCNGAVPRARLSNMSEIEPFSWGYRNGYALRFAPSVHPLAGGLLVAENGADDAGARPANNAPDSLHLRAGIRMVLRIITAGPTATGFAGEPGGVQPDRRAGGRPLRV